ncbi:MAG: hypothetical protein QM779_06340 [Propionicimonas sp.]|uniref:hypothetical protein n=1 Tax=Propionicimonas sp. TaxID=1955623 RepID=UPI003D0FFBF7
MPYERLDADAVLATAQRLQARIGARFPGRNLTRVAAQLVAVASDVEKAAARTVPIRVLRVAGLVAIAALVVLTAVSVVASVAELATSGGTTLTWLSAAETIVNDIVYVGIAVVFVWLLPAHLERRRILGELHRLRSLAHVIDMHQLTKDPERFASAFRPTAQTVEVGLSPIDMASYLDYCSELLALVAKTAAVYAERTTDPAVLATISDIENLTSGMARKIWQKLGLLPRVSRDVGLEPAD